MGNSAASESSAPSFPRLHVPQSTSASIRDLFTAQQIATLADALAVDKADLETDFHPLGDAGAEGGKFILKVRYLIGENSAPAVAALLNAEYYKAFGDPLRFTPNFGAYVEGEHQMLACLTFTTQTRTQMVDALLNLENEIGYVLCYNDMIFKMKKGHGFKQAKSEFQAELNATKFTYSPEM